VAHDKAVIALSLGRERVVDRLDRAAKFREPTEIPIRRVHALELDAGTRCRDLAEIGAEALEISCVPRLVDEALPEEPHEAPVPANGRVGTQPRPGKSAQNYFNAKVSPTGESRPDQTRRGRSAARVVILVVGQLTAKSFSS
jgi:hypothetical protein